MINDTHFAQFISPFKFGNTAGTWTPTVASGVVSNVRSAASASFTALIPVVLPSNQSALKGAYLTSIDVFYTIGTADLTDFATVELEKMTLPVPAAATGTAFSASQPTITEDAYHNTAALRKAQGNHTMTVTLSTPVWEDDNDAYWLQLVLSCATTSVVAMLGARANFTLRA